MQSANMLMGPRDPKVGADFGSRASPSGPSWKVSAFSNTEQYWVLGGLFPSSFMIALTVIIHTFSH